MKTIAITGLKGGVGKTTICLQIAFSAHSRGRSTLIADLDPLTTAARIAGARDVFGPIPQTSNAAKLYNLQMKAAKGGCDYLLVDTPANDKETLAATMALCDFALVVMRPTHIDLEAAVHTAMAARQLRRPAFGLINQAPATKGGRELPAVARAKRAVAAMGLTLIEPVIRYRQAYQTSLSHSQGVEEAMNSPGAAEEMAALFDSLEALSGRGGR